MKRNLKGAKVVIIGGDKRQLYLARKLLDNEIMIVLYGFEKINKNNFPLNMSEFVGKDMLSDVKNCDVIILPMPGVDNEGNIFTPYSDKPIVFNKTLGDEIKPGIPIYVGIESEYLKTLKKNYDWYVVPIAEMDHIAIYNSIPTAEGAIEIALRELPITIHSSKCFILGFGRVGITLARTLKALGAHVTIAARNLSQLARAYEMGCKTVNLKVVRQYISNSDIIFNTIPDLILDEEILLCISKKSLIIDLASRPGGTDFEAAKKLGIKAIFAPGLPGKVAPQTSGEMLGEVLIQMLPNHINGGAEHESERA